VATVSGPGVVVDVEGRVAEPGVRTLPPGSRVIDALTAAGGALPGTDLSALNQARVLVDGEQVLVGLVPPAGAPATVPGRGGRGKGGRAGEGGAQPVHLNSAAAEDLEELPGIGPALAQRIVDYRTAHGPFHSVDDLQQVSGFGGQRFQTLAPLLAL
jgi:competence protein ComEA